MNKIYLELGILFLFVSMNAVYFAFSFFENYHASYVRQVHPEYSESLIYICSIFLEIGLVGVNFLISPLIKLIGLYHLIQLNGILVMITMAIMVYWKHIIGFYMVYLLSGATHQITIFSVIMIITTKYEDQKVKYTGYVFTGSSLAFFLWGGLSKLIINPHNLKQTEVAMTSEGPQKYFSSQVTDNVPYFCLLYGLANLFVSFFTSWVLPCFDREKEEINPRLEILTQKSFADTDQKSMLSLCGARNDEIIDLTVNEAKLLRPFSQILTKNKFSRNIENQIREMEKGFFKRKAYHSISHYNRDDAFDFDVKPRSLYSYSKIKLISNETKI